MIWVVRLGMNISLKNYGKKFKFSLKILVICFLISSSITKPSSANAGDSKYEDSWQKVSGSLTADDAAEDRASLMQFKLVDNYELFDIPDGAEVSIYIKGNPTNNGFGLCDPFGIVYDITETLPGQNILLKDDGGQGGATDGYTGSTCGLGSNWDSFFTLGVTTVFWQSNFRIQVTSSGRLLSETDRTLNDTNSGDYTLYVSVGNFGSIENSSTTAPWVGEQSVTCPIPNPWVKEQLGFAKNTKPVLVSAENTIGKTITQGPYDSLKSSGVVFDTVSTKVSTATETLPIYGCKDKLLSGKVNQPIQFIAGGYTLQSDAHGYINTADLKWHDTNGVTLYTNTAAFMHTIKFTKRGKYVVVLTEQPDTSRGLIPTYGVRSIRFVININ
jgi:hypothetical protein